MSPEDIKYMENYFKDNLLPFSEKKIEQKTKIHVNKLEIKNKKKVQQLQELEASIDSKIEILNGITKDIDKKLENLYSFDSRLTKMEQLKFSRNDVIEEIIKRIQE